MEKNKFNYAFTLVELLVVVTIIGLLAGGAAVSYTKFNQQSRDARRKTDLEQIRSAVEMYRSNNNTYPASINAGGNLCDPIGCPPDGNMYLQKIPTDPKSDDYAYYYDGSSSDYTIGAYLEGSSTCGSTIDCGNNNCNYCLGPYGQK